MVKFCWRGEASEPVTADDLTGELSQEAEDFIDFVGRQGRTVQRLCRRIHCNGGRGALRFWLGLTAYLDNYFDHIFLIDQFLTRAYTSAFGEQDGQCVPRVVRCPRLTREGVCGLR